MKKAKLAKLKPGLQLGLILSSIIVLSAQAKNNSAIEIYFNQNQKTSYIDPARNFKRSGDNLEKVVCGRIASAKERVWVAVFEFDLMRVAQALVAQKKLGVDVRVMVNEPTPEPQEAWELLNIIPQQNEIMGVESAAVKYLRSQGVDVRDNSEGVGHTGLMHHKFIVVDNEIVVSGSANFTESEFHGDSDSVVSRGNANSLLVFNSKGINQHFSEEFEILWSGRFGRAKPFRSAQSFWLGGHEVKIQFSPGTPFKDSAAHTPSDTQSLVPRKDTIDLMDDLLSTAQKSVDFGLFVFSHQRLANSLNQSFSDRQINIRGLIDPGFIYRDYSEALDIWGLEMLGRNCQIEKGNLPWQRPKQSVGTPQLPLGDKLHHKFAVIDGHKVITGSHNWSESAELRNDETLIVIDDTEVAKSYTQEFTNLSSRDPIWGAPERVLTTIEKMNFECNL